MMINSYLQQHMHRQLSQLSVGHLQWCEKGKTVNFGKQGTTPFVRVTIHNESFYRKCVLGGSIGAAESYMQGDWDCSELVDLFEMLISHPSLMHGLEKGLARWLNVLRRCKKALIRNHTQRAKQNIVKHYDLSNAFFGLFLDEGMQYSSAIFTPAHTTLAAAQVHKLSVICDKLQLNSQDHLLEIGTGWGALALYAAKHYGCKVTTTTVSDQQYDYVASQIRALGLEQQITLLRKDYRELVGQYDKLVSIEMIESIGHQYIAPFFEICNRLLKPKGLLLIQSITIMDQVYDRYKYEHDFINTYIFPNGCLPSLYAMLAAIKKRTALRVCDIQDIGLSYAKTLEHWCHRFQNQSVAIQDLGFDRIFQRMFFFYFCYCQAAFQSRYLTNQQLLLEKLPYV